MKHLFVPYELALKLKEKGFDEQCLMVYESKDSLIPESEAGSNYTNVDAPLYQQVQDWFREKHNIHIKVDDFLNNDDKVEWDFEIVKIGTDVDENGNYIPLVSYSIDDEDRMNLSYYEALTKAIEEVIKLI